MHPPIQLERTWHRALAGVLAAVIAGLAPLPLLGVAWLGLWGHAPREVLGIVALVAVPLSLSLAWTALLGLRDVLVGYELRFADGRLSWPRHLWRHSRPLAELRDAELGAPIPDIVLVCRDGTRIDLVGTSALNEGDKLAAIEAIRVMIPPCPEPTASSPWSSPPAQTR